LQTIGTKNVDSLDNWIAGNRFESHQ